MRSAVGSVRAEVRTAPNEGEALAFVFTLAPLPSAPGTRASWVPHPSITVLITSTPLAEAEGEGGEIVLAATSIEPDR